MTENGWITTWKEIARYIGRSVKTAKKYHKSYGLPIRRGPNNTRHAIGYEMDQWLINFDEIKKFQKM